LFFQKLISDDRFRSENEEDAESQLPVQFLATVASTPSLADEVQVEVMKVTISNEEISLAIVIKEAVLHGTRVQ